MNDKPIRRIIDGAMTIGGLSCAGCRKPIVVGERALEFRAAWYHYTCQHEAKLHFDDPDVSVGATRERLRQLKSRIQLGSLDADTMRAALLALLDEALR